MPIGPPVLGPLGSKDVVAALFGLLVLESCLADPWKLLPESNRLAFSGANDPLLGGCTLSGCLFA